MLTAKKIIDPIHQTNEEFEVTLISPAAHLSLSFLVLSELTGRSEQRLLFNT